MGRWAVVLCKLRDDPVFSFRWVTANPRDYKKARHSQSNVLYPRQKNEYDADLEGR